MTASNATRILGLLENIRPGWLHDVFRQVSPTLNALKYVAGFTGYGVITVGGEEVRRARSYLRVLVDEDASRAVLLRAVADAAELTGDAWALALDGRLGDQTIASSGPGWRIDGSLQNSEGYLVRAIGRTAAVFHHLGDIPHIAIDDGKLMRDAETDRIEIRMRVWGNVFTSDELGRKIPAEPKIEPYKGAACPQ